MHATSSIIFIRNVSIHLSPPKAYSLSRIASALSLRIRQGRSHLPVYDTDHMRMHVKDACLHYIRVYVQLPACECAFSIFLVVRMQAASARVLRSPFPLLAT